MRQEGLGSGVVVAPNVVLTNAHVVQGSDEITVTHGDRREFKATLAGADAKSDLAVLKLNGKGKEELQPIQVRLIRRGSDSATPSSRSATRSASVRP